MAFLNEPPPAYGTPTHIAPGIRRLVAPNPGPMTYHGTNTWLLDGPDGLTVIDPGPHDHAHIAAIQAAGPIARILLTHTHPDHVDAAPALKAATGAPTYAWGAPWHKTFRPDHAIAHGETLAGLIALHTPGHASDHLCFAAANGTLFTGDHVMSWNTSIVSPPDGNMAHYMDNLRVLLARNDALYLCGHGPPLPDPQSLVRAMLGHRMGRETAVLAALGDKPVTSMAIVDRLYLGLSPQLKKAADRTVIAHLHKLVAEGRAAETGDGFVKM